MTRYANGLLRVTIGDQDVFPVYGASGGLINRQVAYLIKEGSGEPPVTISGDLGIPLHSEPFKIVEHERGWKHAAIWMDDEYSLDSAAKELLSA